MDFQQFAKELAARLGCTIDAAQNSPEIKMEVLLDNKRKQELIISEASESDRIIRLHSPTGKREDFSEKKLVSALELNSSLLYGAFALLNEELVIAETMSMENTTGEEAAKIAMYLVKMADTYEQMTSGLDRY